MKHISAWHDNINSLPSKHPSEISRACWRTQAKLRRELQTSSILCSLAVSWELAHQAREALCCCPSIARAWLWAVVPLHPLTALLPLCDGSMTSQPIFQSCRDPSLQGKPLLPPWFRQTISWHTAVDQSLCGASMAVVEEFPEKLGWGFANTLVKGKTGLLICLYLP